MRARRNDDLLRRIAVAADRDRLRAGELRFAHHDLDLVGLAQRSHAGGQLLHHRGAESLDLFPVDLHIGADDADVRAVGGRLIDLGGMQHGFGRHTAAVEAGAADLVLFDQGHLGAQLRGPDRRDITAGAAAHHQDAARVTGRGSRRGRRRSCGRRGRSRRGTTVRDSLSGRAEPADQGLAGHRLSGRNQDLQQNAVRFRLHVVCQFVGFHREENLALLHRVADVFLPLVDRALGHRQAELRH